MVNYALNFKQPLRQNRLKGATKVYFAVGGGNLTNYVLTIDDAIAACEVLPCNNNNSISQISLADELAKLKDLLDKGAITQNEYDSAKSKILARY